MARLHLWLVCGLVVLCGLLPGLMGCRDRYLVQHAASPNPFAEVRTFALEPLGFSASMHIEGKAEVDWLVHQRDEVRHAWPAGKTAMIASFGRGLRTDAESAGLTIVAAPGATGSYLIRAVVTHVEPGFFEGPISADTMVEIDVEIVSDTGIVLDVITSRASVPATALNLDLVDRLRDAGKDVGQNVARYLRDRTGT